MNEHRLSHEANLARLLTEHYEESEMNEAFRASLLDRTRRVVASRRRTRLRRWTLRVAGGAAVIVGGLLIWQMGSHRPSTTAKPPRTEQAPAVVELPERDVGEQAPRPGQVVTPPDKGTPRPQTPKRIAPSGMREDVAWVGFSMLDVARRAEVARLAAQLKDPDWMVRQASAEALGALEYPPSHRFLLTRYAVEPLIAAMADARPSVRRAVVYALAEIGDARAVGPLIASLQGEEVASCLGYYVGPDGSGWDCPSVKALGKLGDPRATAPLISLLKHKEVMARWTAAWALGEIADKAAVEPLIAALKDPEPHVRADAARALGRIGDPRAAEALIAVLKDGGRVRDEAIQALGRIGDPRAVAALISELQSKDESVRFEAARALGETGDTSAVEPLMPLLKDEGARVREVAAESLAGIRVGAKKAQRELGAEAGVTAAVNALRQHDPSLRRAAVDFLAELRKPSAQKGLASALADRDPAVRHKAAIALSKYVDYSATEQLLDALKSDDRLIRSEAMDALGDLREPRAVEPLATLLSSDDPDTVERAAQALGRIGSSAAPPLIGVLGNKQDSTVVFAATQALGRIGDYLCIQALVDLSHDKDPQARSDAILGLAGAAGPRELLASVGDVNEPLKDIWAGPDERRIREEVFVAALGDDELERGVQEAAAWALARRGWKPADRVQKMRYLVAAQRWEEAAQVASALKTSAGRAKGRLEFDLPIIVPLLARLDGYDVVTTRWIEFERSGDGANATLFFDLLSWPPSTWRVHTELLDSRSRVISEAEASFKTAGIIERIPSSSREKKSFDLGPWSKASRAARFAVTLERNP